MKSQVTFRAAKFPAYDGEEEEINPGIWGKRLAEFLVEKLQSEGVEVLGFDAEDWGYMISIKNDGFKLGVACGHQSGESDEFLCFIHPDKPVIRKLFKRIDTTEAVGRVTFALDRILADEPDIRDVEWVE